MNKTSSEMEAVLCNTSRLTKICQNENKWNSSCGTVIRKLLHDRFSSGSLNGIDVDACSKNKTMTHPKRTATDENSLTIAGKRFLNRALLEKERKFFGSIEDVNFVEYGEDCDVILSDRKKAVFLLDK